MKPALRRPRAVEPLGAQRRRLRLTCVWPVLASLGVWAALLPAAHADVWGYVDAKGIAHFATRRLDDRYELFFKAGQSFDTRNSAAPQLLASGTSAASTGQLRMVALVDSSPNFKTVTTHLRAAAEAHKIDYDLLKALIVTESGFNSTAVSPKGAVGLMQIMPATAERYGVRGDARGAIEDKLTDPKINIGTGTRYLRFLLDLFPGRLDLAVAAYNAGEGAVQRAGNRIPNYPETQDYVRRVLQIYNASRPALLAADAPSRIGPHRVRMELPAGNPRLMAPGTEHILASSDTAARTDAHGLTPLGMRDVTVVDQ